MNEIDKSKIKGKFEPKRPDGSVSLGICCSCQKAFSCRNAKHMVDECDDFEFLTVGVRKEDE